MNIAIPTPARAVIAGAPRLDLSYSGTAGKGTRPTWVVAQIVDPATNIVLGN